MIKKRIVHFIYAIKSAFDFLLCRIHSSHCSGTNAPCCRAEEDVGEEGGLVCELPVGRCFSLITEEKLAASL